MIPSMDRRGFSLIELLITVSIIAILVGVAVSGYIGVTKKATRSEAYSNLESLRILEEEFFADRGEYAPELPGVLVGTAAIQAELPGFRPGNNLSYIYAVRKDFEWNPGGGNSTANQPATGPSPNPCFVATATGITGTRVCPDGPGPNCDMFAIDCNNDRNF